MRIINMVLVLLINHNAMIWKMRSLVKFMIIFKKSNILGRIYKVGPKLGISKQYALERLNRMEQYFGYPSLVVQCDDYISGRKRRAAYQDLLPRRQRSESKPLDKTLITGTALQNYSPQKRIRDPTRISRMGNFDSINEPSIRSFRID